MAMVNQFKDGEALFDFTMQLQTDPETMPIQDLRHEWSEALLTFRKVATIRIFPQEFDSEQQRQFGDNLSFTPWQALPEHRPLVGVNRARKIIYQAISIFRHEYNHTIRKEPHSYTL